ncbi:MAG: GNAT family N-acetyltransferase [Anaerolineaceae bacterium 4572_32.2]|nr:MAG: GNAT family N-acetyltransferase [Anaerolineaceae bacterium 4572_32.2]
MTISKLLCGDRVRLTALNTSDLPTLVHWFEDAEFMRLYDARPARPKSEAELGRWLEELHKAKDDFAFAVRPLDSQDLIGYVELDGILWPHGVCGFSIGIGERSHWGQGYGYEAARLALAFAFGELNLHRVTATVFSYNKRSIALFEKLGFQREGAFREFLQRDGKRYDMLLYGLLKHEWEAGSEQ